MNRLRRNSLLLRLVLPLLMTGCAERLDPLAPSGSPDGPAHLLITDGGYVQVATGSIHTCALRNDGSVACWGRSSHGQTDVPADLADVTQVSAGRFHTCALRSDGTVTCWGNVVGVPMSVPMPDGLSDVTQVSAGGNHTCALRSDRTVVCWGAYGDGQTNIPVDLTEVTQVSAGGRYVCALQSEGTVVCWGYLEQEVPMPDGLSDATQVSAGEFDTCALRNNGTVVCWGGNRSGVAVPPADLSGVTQLSTGFARGCALRIDRTVVCWGSNPNVPESFTDATQLGQGADSPGVCALRLDSTIVCDGMPSPPGIRVYPTATFSATPGSVVAGESFTLALGDAQVSGHPEATEFTYAFDCGDGSGYSPFTTSATATCPTTMIGTRQVRGTVRDQDGDEREYPAEVEIRPFFAFSGFLAPVREDVLNQVRAGQGVPIRFSLGGDHGLEIFGAEPTSSLIDCDVTVGTSDVAETATAGKSSLTYDPTTQIYTYVWKTQKGWGSSCRRLELQLADGQVWAADFHFSR